MFESDADRESMIRALGGVRLSFPRGEVWAVLEEGFDEASVGALAVEGTQPYATCLTSAAQCLGLGKGVQGTLGARVLKIVRVEPDGTGMSRLVFHG